MTRKAILGTVVVVLFLLTSGLSGVGGAATDASVATDASPAPNAQETTTAEGNETENATASVTFEDQQSNGSVIIVNRTNLTAGGFLVILNDSGAIIANTSFLEPGVHQNLTVQLNVTLNESQVLVAVPHLDTNDNEMFDFNATQAAEVGVENATDRPIFVNGTPVSDTAFVTIGNETSERGTNESRRELW